MRITNQLQSRQNLLNYQSSAAKNYDSIEKLSAHMKITKPYEDVGIYVDATRLDYEATTLEQIKEATTKASEFAKNTDQTLNDFADTLDSFKVKLIQAANSGEHSTTSRVAIANDLKAMRDQLVSISNTAINGQYLFSGTAVDTKPISADGTYNGNGNNIEVLAGSNLTVPFNIPGEGLFLGRDNDYAKQVTTNITLINKHEELNPQNGNKEYMRLTDEIYKFIGTDYRTSAKIAADGKMNYTTDFTRDKVKDLPPTVFFMQGQRPSGESFSTKFELSAGAKVSDLLEQMGRAMGNTDTNKVVEVSINKDAQIQMTNLQNGNEMMSFSIFGLTAQEGTAQEANLWKTDKIQKATSLEEIKQAVAAGNVHLTSFISSPNYVSPDDGIATATDYDKVNFANKGATVQNNTSQIVRKDNSFATNNTRLSEVAGLSSGQIGAVGGGNPNAAGTTLAKADDLIIDVTAKNGNRYKATIDFNGTQVTDPVTKVVTTYPTITIRQPPFQPDKAVYQGNFYKTFWNEQIDPNANPPRQIGNQAKMVETDDLSFKEINDMLTILASGNLDKMQGKNHTNPKTQQDLDAAYAAFEETFLQASVSVESTMDHRGLITLKDKTTSATNIKIAMYQDHGGKDYPDAVGTANTKSASVLSFNKNDAVTIDRPSIDLFADLDDMIEAVFNGDFYGNANGVNPRTSGVQGAIKRLDHIMDHVNKIHAIAGTNSRHITDTNERATTLYLNVAEVKSSVIDADYGELAMQFQNNLLAYQAMLQATSKINQISLLNYM
ncbi:flagellin N-terminal helical domain-containing protein [Campylobacter magnus]|uniref:flagellin N-terminal helical domain-containing protein n=1 Tax=Campylobacter magnus TaxID=3026462 RepID=UPI0023620082|nr:flagellin [Campylobacter magnus]MDD0855587.1 flagellin [Campylobacter magnus]